MSRELVRPVVAEIERLGGRVIKIVPTGKGHVGLRWSHPVTGEHVMVFPHSASDHRSFLNTRAQVRRLARGVSL